MTKLHKPKVINQPCLCGALNAYLLVREQFRVCGQLHQGWSIEDWIRDCRCPLTEAARENLIRSAS